MFEQLTNEGSTGSSGKIQGKSGFVATRETGINLQTISLSLPSHDIFIQQDFIFLC